MAASSTAQDCNRELARQINEEARDNPQFCRNCQWRGRRRRGQLGRFSAALAPVRARHRQDFLPGSGRGLQRRSRNLGTRLMPRQQWPLLHDRPQVQVTLVAAADGQPAQRNLLADTGAGTAYAGFEIILEEQDCLIAGGIPSQPVVLGGAYKGSYSVYLIRVQIPSLGFDHYVPAVGVPAVPVGFDGIACFRFLNRFHYGNFGDTGSFGLET